MNPALKSARLALLPSLLMVSLALSACENSTLPTEGDTQEAADKISETNDISVAASTDGISNADLTVDETMTAEQTVEKKMIDELTRHRWTLSTATDGTTQPLTSLMDIKDQVTLNFNQYQGQDTVSYSVGCNTMSAAYKLQDRTLTTEDSMSTKMSCGDLDTAENSLNKLMQGDSQLSLVEGENPMLTQVTGDSTTLVWTGRLNAQAKYNTKGETIFWAVSSKTKPCEGNSAQMCLQVKPVTYNDQGIKTSEGEWGAFTSSIDGYQHDGKHDEVLRLQRYKLDADDMKQETTGAEYAYVLDTVIESTVVK